MAKTSLFSQLVAFFFDLRVSFPIFLGFVIGYLILLDEEGAFKNKFLRIGPSENTTYLNMKVNTWEKVIIVYLIVFFSAIFTTYYGTVSRQFIHQYIWNPAYTEPIKMTKLMATIILTIEPILYFVLRVLNMFAGFTMELQFILPGFLGMMVIGIPYDLYIISQNTFIG